MLVFIFLQFCNIFNLKTLTLLIWNFHWKSSKKKQFPFIIQTRIIYFIWNIIFSRIYSIRFIELQIINLLPIFSNFIEGMYNIFFKNVNLDN